MELAELSRSSIIISNVTTNLIRQQLGHNILRGTSSMLMRSNIRSFSTHRPLYQPRFKPIHPINRANLMVSPNMNNNPSLVMPKRDFHFPVPIFLLATRLGDSEKGKKIILASSVLWMFPGACSTLLAGGLIYYGFKHVNRHMYYQGRYPTLPDSERNRKCHEFFERSKFMHEADVQKAKEYFHSTMKRSGEKIIEISEQFKPEPMDYQHQTRELKGQAIQSISMILNSPHVYQSLKLTPEQQLLFGGLFENPDQLEFGSIDFVKQEPRIFDSDEVVIQFNLVSRSSFLKVEAKGKVHNGFMTLTKLNLKSVDGNLKLKLPIRSKHY